MAYDYRLDQYVNEFCAAKHHSDDERAAAKLIRAHLGVYLIAADDRDGAAPAHDGATTPEFIAYVHARAEYDRGGSFTNVHFAAGELLAAKRAALDAV